MSRQNKEVEGLGESLLHLLETHRIPSHSRMSHPLYRQNKEVEGLGESLLHLLETHRIPSRPREKERTRVK